MLRLSTTTLESFRRVIHTEYAQEEELVAQVRGEPFEATWQMQAGSAWDRAISDQRIETCVAKTDPGNLFLSEEDASTAAERTKSDQVVPFPCLACGQWHIGKPQRVRVGGYSFSDMAISRARLNIGRGIWQAKNTRQFDTPFGPANIVGVADHLRGLLVQENKAKFSTPDAKNYEASLQWRFYLMIFGAPCVRYNLFDFRDPKDGYCELTNILSFRFWRYADLDADCHRWVNAFLQWASERGLLGFLDREGS